MSKTLNHSTVSKFVLRVWIEVNDLSGGQYFANKKVKFKTPLLRSDICDYSDAYITVKERISVTSTNNANRRNKKLVMLDSDYAYQKSIAHL